MPHNSPRLPVDLGTETKSEDRVSVTLTGLRLVAILLPQPPDCWGNRHGHSLPICFCLLHKGTTPTLWPGLLLGMTSPTFQRARFTLGRGQTNP